LKLGLGYSHQQQHTYPHIIIIINNNNNNNNNMPEEMTEAERKMQERLAVYKKKMAAKKEEEAVKNLELQKKKDEKQNKRLEKLARTQALIEEEKRKALAKMDEVKRAQKEQMERQKEMEEEKKRNLAKLEEQKKEMATKPIPSTRKSPKNNSSHHASTTSNLRSKFQREMSKTLDAEHGIMMEAEETFEKQEKVMQSRLNQYKNKLEERKKKEAEEKAAIEKQKEEERRQREEEAEKERRRMEEQLASLKQRAEVAKPIPAETKKKYGGGSSPWESKEALEAKKKQQEGKVMTWREKQEAKKKADEEKRIREAEAKQQAEEQAEKERQGAMKKMNTSVSVMETVGEERAPNNIADSAKKDGQLQTASKKPFNANASFNTPADTDWKKKRSEGDPSTAKAELDRLADERRKQDEEHLKAQQEAEEAAKREQLEKERAEAKRRAEEDAKARFEAQRRKELEERERIAAEKRKEEEEKAKAAAEKRRQDEEAEMKASKERRQTMLVEASQRRAAEAKAEKEAAEKRRLEAEKAEKARLERQQQAEEARIAQEKRRKEEEEARIAIEKRRTEEKAEQERLEKEREKEESALALEEAKKREADRKRAREEQEKAIKAADAARAKARGVVAAAESESEEEDSDDDDEDWGAEDKARFLAEAKAEVAKKNALVNAKKQKEEETKKRAAAAKAEGDARMASMAAKRKLIMTDTIPAFLLEIEADETFESDVDIVQSVEEYKKMREYVAALQSKQIEAEEREMKQINEVEDKLRAEKEAYRKHASQGLVLRTPDEEEDIERQSKECKEIIASLRKENQKIRDNGKAMAEEMRGLYIHNQRLEEAKKTTEEFQSQLSRFEDKETGKGEQLEAMTSKYKEAIDDHEEALAMRTLAGDVENKIKNVYEKLINQVVVKFQSECHDDVLVLELGSIALGEMGLDEDGDDLSVVSRSFHTPKTSHDDDDNDDEEDDDDDGDDDDDDEIN
jgi:hypothetical protein